MRTIIAAALLLVLFTAPSLVSAASCGDGIAVCACGDTVNGSYTMTASLACATGHGLRVASATILDCAGFSVSGAGISGTYGIYLTTAVGSVVKNCTVVQFERGVRLNAAHDNLVQNIASGANGNFTTHVGYGVDLAGDSGGNLLVRLLVLGNADEGIHVGASAHGNILSASSSCGNFRESVYLLSNDNVLTGNDIGHDCYGYVAGATAFYAKDATGTLLWGNHFHKGTVHVTGASVRTINLFSFYDGGASYVEDCYAGGGCPTQTVTIP